MKFCVDQGELLPYPDSYRRLVEKLNYLTITRLDISFAVSVISQFMSSPRSTHVEAALRIVMYLKADPGRDLFYRVNGHLHVEAFTDLDWVGSPSNMRSTVGYCPFLGGNLVSKK